MLLTEFSTWGTVAIISLFLGGIICLAASIFWTIRLLRKKRNQASNFQDLKDHNKKYKVFNLYIAIFLIFASCVIIILSFGFLLDLIFNI